MNFNIKYIKLDSIFQEMEKHQWGDNQIDDEKKIKVIAFAQLLPVIENMKMYIPNKENIIRVINSYSNHNYMVKTCCIH